jgi:hypothetical protein
MNAGIASEHLVRAAMRDILVRPFDLEEQLFSDIHKVVLNPITHTGSIR